MTRRQRAWQAAGGGILVLVTVVVCHRVVAAAGADWPQWRGPARTGISTETGLLQQWPPNGPPLAWSTRNLGTGFGSVAVAGDRLFVQGLRDGQSIVSAISVADGRSLWSKALGPGGENSRGSGPRGTPTVDGDRVYVLSENGDLYCLKPDGTELWKKNILREFGGQNLNWLLSESPLVDGDQLIVTPGGRNATMAALNKMTGATIWRSRGLSDEAAYASPIAADVVTGAEKVRVYMTFTAEAAVGVRAIDGKPMFKYQQVANSTANVATPIFFDNKVFFASNYDTGGALLGLRAENGEVRAQEIYFTREMQNHHGGMVLLDGYLYGFNNHILTCLEFATGKLMWRHRSVGKGALTAADGRLYVMSEEHKVGLVEVNPREYKEHGRFSLEDTGHYSWAHPVVSGGHLFVRNDTTLLKYDVRAR